MFVDVTLKYEQKFKCPNIFLDIMLSKAVSLSYTALTWAEIIENEMGLQNFEVKFNQKLNEEHTIL